MGIPNPLETAVLTAAALQVAKQGQDFIAAALGHPGESLGAILGNFGRRRFQNMETIGSKAHLILLDIGVTPQEVPLNIMLPALEAASLQDQSELQTTWANLLANAADPRRQNPVEPSFAGILRELSHREVKFLDALLSQMKGIQELSLGEAGLANLYIEAGLARHRTFPALSKSKLNLSAADILGRENFIEFRLILDLLERARILLKESEFENIDHRQIRDIVQDIYDVEPLGINVVEYYSLTQLGIAFIRACQKPKL